MRFVACSLGAVMARPHAGVETSLFLLMGALESSCRSLRRAGCLAPGMAAYKALLREGLRCRTGAGRWPWLRGALMGCSAPSVP